MYLFRIQIVPSNGNNLEFLKGLKPVDQDQNRRST